MKIKPIKNFHRVIQPPPDKSIMQRAVILGWLRGQITIENPSFCGDALSAIDCVSKLGAEVFMDGGALTIKRTAGRQAISDKPVPESATVVDAGNSATTARLLLAAAAGLGINIKIVGDSSLNRRDMAQIVRALEAFGAKIDSQNHRLPLINLPSKLKAANFAVSPPSAQIKSAAIIAALFADDNEPSQIFELNISRDHTERMLAAFGAKIECDDGEFMENGRLFRRKITVYKGIFNDTKTTDFPLKVAGDFSSAAFSIALTAAVKNSKVMIKNCGLNPTRLGMLDVLTRAGLKISAEVLGENCGEPYGNIYAQWREINGFDIDESILQTLIDEVPALAVCACFARGKSVFSGLSALKNKESNRILGIFDGLKQLGADIIMKGDTLVFAGGGLDKKAQIDIKSDDHRIVMALSVAAAAAGGGRVSNPKAAEVSYPSFFEDVIL